MSLAEKLDEIRRHYDQEVPADAMALMHRAVADLEASGAANRIAGVGEQLPSFTLPNQFGETLSSGEVLRFGPLVLTAYRGFW